MVGPILNGESMVGLILSGESMVCLILSGESMVGGGQIYWPPLGHEVSPGCAPQHDVLVFYSS